MIIPHPHDCAEHGILGTGSLNSDIAIVGIAPGQDEWRSSRQPFTGSSGRLLNATLKACGTQREDVFTTNLLCWWKNAPDQGDIDACSDRLRRELTAVQPRLIVACGEIVTRQFLPEHAKRTFAALRGGVYWSPTWSCWIMPTYHPAAFLYADSNADIADFGRDLYKLPRVVTWPLDASYGEVPYRVAETAVQADIWLRDLEGLVALDVETTYDGKTSVYETFFKDDELLCYQDSKLLCFSVASNKGVFVIPGNIASQLNPGWGSNDKVQWAGHGFIFDKAQVKRLMGEELTLTEDTLLMSYSVDERGGKVEENDRAVGIHGLKKLLREYCGIGFYDINVLKATPPELHQYNAIDSGGCRRLFFELEARQVNDGVRDSFYKSLLVPASNALAEMQEYGAYIDRSVIADFAIEWMPQWLELEQQLIDEAREMGWPADKDMNLNSAPQMIHFVYDIMGAPEINLKKAGDRTRGGTYRGNASGRTTNRQAMDELAEGYPWCNKLRLWRNIDHLISSYITGIEDDIKFDGCIHAEPLLHGTRPGRMSYHKPPVQTIPNKGVDPEQAKLRRMFAARPPRLAGGRKKVLLEADFKQAEFWATYLASGDTGLLEELESGDIHGEVAKRIFNVDEAYEHFGILRFLTKVTNFGILYGRQAQGFVDSMWRGHQPPPAVQQGLIKWDLAAAQKFIKDWEARHPNVVRWRLKEIQGAMRTGEQQTVTGRKRRYWIPTYKTLTQSINFIPQSTAHDHLLMSLIELHYLLKEFDAHILFEVHDALVIEADEEWLDETCRLVKTVMERPKFGFSRGIPTDIKVGPNWYDLKEYKFDG